MNMQASSNGVIAIGSQVTFDHHRCGWRYAVDALQPENNEAGIRFHGFLDRTFSPALNPDYHKILPFKEKWTGFFHNPAQMPSWFPDDPRLSHMFRKDEFQRSLEYCVGVFALSEHLASYLRSQLNVPTSALIHPTEIPATTFSYEAFLANQRKKIVSVGWWLRRTMSIIYLPLEAKSPYRKARLQVSDRLIENSHRAISRLEFVHDWGHRKLEQRFRDNVEELAYLPNDSFDRLLSENIVFLDLYDTSANNAVVECIARATPLLVNPLPAIIEYLGDSYPFYFDSLEEAADKALDFDMVRRTHEYLLTCQTRTRLSQDSFVTDFRKSEVYSHLRTSHSEISNKEQSRYLRSD